MCWRFLTKKEKKVLERKGRLEITRNRYRMKLREYKTPLK